MKDLYKWGKNYTINYLKKEVKTLKSLFYINHRKMV
jgi:hypothetical protein